MPDALNDEVVGRYQVRGSLGASSTGLIVKAFDPELERTVALKLIRSDGAASARARLLAEAQALAKLQHRNLVTIYDVGTEGEQVFLAMELILGPTLDAWLEAAPRSWRAVRDVFLSAGRGLAAAHAAGIVHRDFGPKRVIIGADRVVVVDFDLAPEESGSAPASALDDQFAFATALRSALDARQVPRHVAAALARALSPRPADRWPTLSQLLAEVARDPGAARRRFAVFAAVGVAVLAAAVTAFVIGQRAAVPALCSRAPALAASIWDEAARTRTQDAFRRTGRSYADETFLRVDASLRQRLGDWASAHHDACEATIVRHAQPPEILDARMVCLGRARTEIAALVSLLGDADAAALDRAASAAGRVGDVSACDNLNALRDAVPPPTDPDRARELERLRGEVGHLEALRLLGKMQEGLEAGHRVVERARRFAYAPVLAAALDKTAWFEVTLGHDDAGIVLGYETARVGAEAHDDALVASGMMHVAFALGFDKQRFESADVAFESARAAAARAGNPGDLLERLYGDREVVIYQKGEYLAVLPLCQVMYALSVRVHGIDSYQAALSLSELADAMHTLGHSAEAAAIFERAEATAEKALGPEHPVTLDIVGNAGVNKLDAGDFDGAAPYFQREMQGAEKVFGPDDASVAIIVHNLGMVRRGQRRLPEARELLGRALKIRMAKLGADHPMLASTLVELAEVARLEGHADEALADLDRAVAIDQKAYATPHVLLARRYRAKADLLVRLGRLGEARAALALAEATLAKTAPDLNERASLRKVSADLLRAAGKPREALAVYAEALPALETQYGRNGPGLVDALLGVGEAELDAADTASALATAERVVNIGTESSIPADELGAAQFLLARVRWACGDDRPGAVALARAARGRLAALPYPAGALPRIDRWLVTVSR